MKVAVSLHIGIMPFNEKNIRNAIANISDLRSLGELLKIPPSQLDEISKVPPQNQKQKFVEVWYKVDSDEYNWKTLQTAIDKMKVSEWKIRNTRSMSSGSYSDGLFSPRSDGVFHQQYFIIEWL